MDPAVDEAISAAFAADATFGPDAAAPATQEAAPPAPSAQQRESPSEPVDAAAPPAPNPSLDPSGSEAAPAEAPPDPSPDSGQALAAQLAALQARLEAAETQAREAEDARQRAEHERTQRDEAAQRQLQERLRSYALEQVRAKLAQPEDLEPHEYQALQQQWAQLHAQPHMQRATQAEGEVERLAAYITVQQISQSYGLNADETQAMAAFPTPQAMEQYAVSIQAAKASREEEVAQMRQQLNDLQLQIAAQGRRESGADTVGSPTGHQVTTNLDDLSGDAYLDAWFTQTFGSRQGSAPPR